jgi:hypothetical protein
MRGARTCAARFTACPQSFKLLYVRAVPQHDFQQLACRFGGIYVPLEALLYEKREPARMVDVRVSYNYTVNLAGVEWKGLAKPIVAALLQATVNKNPFAAGLNTMATPGHFPRRTIKANFHVASILL